MRFEKLRQRIARIGEAAERLFTPPPVMMPYNLDGLTVMVDVEQLGPFTIFGDINKNLEKAQSEGVKPLSIKEVLDQITTGYEQVIVLFDTPPTGEEYSNHWRILSIEGETATIQMCGVFGNYDTPALQPVEIPITQPICTGLTILGYVNSQGSIVSLAEYQKDTDPTKNHYPYGGSPKHKSLLWSNENGRLVSQAEHPAFQSRQKN